MRKILLIGLLAVIGCGEEDKTPPIPKSKQVYNGPEVFNVEHDGHKFIVFRQFYWKDGVSIFVLPHPDQPTAEKSP